MKSKVLTYLNPSNLFCDQQNSKIFNQVIHVCATSNLADAVQEAIVSDSVIDSGDVISMSEYSAIMYDAWNSEEQKLIQFLELSDWLNQSDFSDEAILRSFKRNKSDVLDTLRLLVIAGMKSFELRESLGEVKSLKEDLLVEILDWFEKLETVKNAIKPSCTSRNQLVEKVKQKSNRQDARVILDSKIIFHGFYFITPEQQIILEYTASLGFEIIFLNYYDASYPERFEFIGSFINSDYGWPNMAQWKPIQTNRVQGLGDEFFSLFEYQPNHQLLDFSKKADINEYSFDNFIDFLSYIEKNEFIEPPAKVIKVTEREIDKSTILATNASYLNERLQEFYPEKYRSLNNFLKYPIGNLLVKLHELWDIEDKVIYADARQIRRLLATKYFFNDNSEYYLMEVYNDISQFFANCRNVEEWDEKFNELLSLRKEIETDFYYASSSKDKYSEEFSVNESPFSYFPYFSISSNNITLIQNKVHSVFKIANQLFEGENSSVVLRSHFEKLLKIVDNSNDYHASTVSDINILDELRKKLNTDIEITEVNKNDLYDAIQFYLSGSSNDEDMMLVKPLINIDGEIFRKRRVHVTGLDENGLPYGEYSMPWPLNMRTVENLAYKNRYLRLLLKRNESVIDITRYLLFLMFQFAQKLEISYMKNYQQNVNLKKSFYIDLMSDFLNPEEKRIETIEETDMPHLPKEELCYDISGYDADQKASFIYCPKRMVFSILDKQVTFPSEFQQKFLLSKLVTYLGINNNHDEVVRLVKSIFPQFSNLSIEIICKDAFPRSDTLKNSQVFKGYDSNICNYRRSFPYLTSKWSNSNTDENKISIKDLYLKGGNLKKIYEKDFSNSVNQGCMYCPYVSICLSSKLNERGGNYG